MSPRENDYYAISDKGRSPTNNIDNQVRKGKSPAFLSTSRNFKRIRSENNLHTNPEGSTEDNNIIGSQLNDTKPNTIPVTQTRDTNPIAVLDKIVVIESP